MSNCGYVCPSCSGSGFNEQGQLCDWCTPKDKEQPSKTIVTDQDWLKSVHEGPCCSDIGMDKDQ